jgi:hypothetical protein
MSNLMSVFDFFELNFVLIFMFLVDSLYGCPPEVEDGFTHYEYSFSHAATAVSEPISDDHCKQFINLLHARLLENDNSESLTDFLVVTTGILLNFTLKKSFNSEQEKDDLVFKLRSDLCSKYRDDLSLQAEKQQEKDVELTSLSSLASKAYSEKLEKDTQKSDETNSKLLCFITSDNFDCEDITSL